MDIEVYKFTLRMGNTKDINVEYLFKFIDNQEIKNNKLKSFKNYLEKIDLAMQFAKKKYV